MNKGGQVFDLRTGGEREKAESTAETPPGSGKEVKRK